MRIQNAGIAALLSLAAATAGGAASAQGLAVRGGVYDADETISGMLDVEGRKVQLETSAGARCAGPVVRSQATLTCSDGRQLSFSFYLGGQEEVAFGAMGMLGDRNMWLDLAR